MSRPGTANSDGRPITPSTTEGGSSRPATPNYAGKKKHSQLHNIVYREDAQPREIPEDELAELAEAFKMFDQDGNGTMNKEELGTVMRSLGQEITHENLDLIFASVDNDKSGCICFDEFLVLMSRFMPPEGNTEDELMAAFQYFDKGKTGTFGLDEIEQAIHQLGMDITPAQMKNMLSCADTDHDGQMTFGDFKHMWIKDEGEEHAFMGGHRAESPTKQRFKEPEVETIH